MDLFLLATVADRLVAIPADEVESVVDIGEITPVPGATPQVRGLAALRSRVMTVISSRYALGAETGRTQAKRAIVTVVRWRAVARGIGEHAGEPILAIGLRGLVPDLAAAA